MRVEGGVCERVTIGTTEKEREKEKHRTRLMFSGVKN